MTDKTKLGSLLLLTTILGGSAAFAQTSGPSPAPATPPSSPPSPPATAPAEEEVEISAPGGSNDEIVVVGTRIPNTIRASREVVSVLTQGDIARTGEGDIAGALQRVTGLSVVGGRFVYVRGLGERYSLALLNGLPIPSPDPLRRVVPLDLFPTSVLASSVVQKSYSVNFPGEFGGGVINLTTRAVPEEPYFSFGGSVGGNTVTTGELGYTFAGGRRDWTGFDDGTLQPPAALRLANNTGNLLFPGANFTLREVQDVTASLVNAESNLVQRNDNIPANFSLNFSGGTSWDVDDMRLGIVASGGWSNNFQTKGGLQQNSTVAIPPGGNTEGIQLVPNQDYRFLSTENRVVVNGLLGFGLEVGEHKVRFVNVYVHDSIKEARIQSGTNDAAFTQVLVNRSTTARFDRQLISTQLVGEFRFDNLSFDVRSTYANSKRLAPYERENSYAFTEQFGINNYINDLRSPGQSARVAFSRLNENVYGGGADLGYKFEGGPFPIRLTGGYAYTDTERVSTRRDYRYQSAKALPIEVAQQRPDFLLSDFNVYTYGVVLNETSATSGAAQYEAGLTTHAGYGQIEIEPVDGVQFVTGVRYESADQFVRPIDLFNLGEEALRQTQLNNDYWLPAGTLTWNFAEDMQFRASASKTIARPQLRELAPQPFLDTDTDRVSIGNQFLIDSQLFNAELRYEWYFGRDERLTLSGFYKDITNPIETISFLSAGNIQTTFANAPKATLFGAEVDVQKYVPLDTLGSDFFASRRLLVAANYTFTNSKIKVRGGDTTVFPFTGETVSAAEFFRDGQPLTGQSDHVANLQLGLSSTDGLSEQTILLNYASDRATNRGPSGQPDLVERPGFRLDVVLRQGIALAGQDLEFKFEARNLTNTRYQEFQALNGSRIDNNSFALGRTFTLGVSANF